MIFRFRVKTGREITSSLTPPLQKYTMNNLILHYAPDNASLCIRLALETLGMPYQTRLVDRSVSAQCSPSYRALNPNGLIPTLETPDGILFETAAILLWLSEQKEGLIAPGGTRRVEDIKWLIWLANTLHPNVQMLFYPDRYGPQDQVEAISAMTRQRIKKHLQIFNQAAEKAHWNEKPTLCAVECYAAPMLRWLQLYPIAAPERPNLLDYPALWALAKKADAAPAGQKAARAEGLGDAPFSAPQYPRPPEGSAL